MTHSSTHQPRTPFLSISVQPAIHGLRKEKTTFASSRNPCFCSLDFTINNFRNMHRNNLTARFIPVWQTAAAAANFIPIPRLNLTYLTFVSPSQSPSHLPTSEYESTVVSVLLWNAVTRLALVINIYLCVHSNKADKLATPLHGLPAWITLINILANTRELKIAATVSPPARSDHFHFRHRKV